MKQVTTSLFDGVSKEEYAAMMTCFKTVVKTYRKGEEVPMPTGRVGVVQRGNISLVKTDINGVRTLFEQSILDALGAEVHADGARRVPNVSHLTFARGGTAFPDVLDLAGVACSAGAACSAHSAKPSHVLTAMGRSEEEALRGVRFSFGMQTTEEEARTAAEIVIQSYRKFTGGIS